MLAEYGADPEVKERGSPNGSAPSQESKHSQNITVLMGCLLGSLPVLLLIFFFRRHLLILIGRVFCYNQRVKKSSSAIIDYLKL
jgi:hypothetical protein